ncbi:hypothetical protein AGR4C_pa50033 [Agrobacterium tumefaciens str. Kerr 14]|uniref:Uncharacterized protein n=1 Tax=Agrobacterium tumefaciens str. Kerr 14 TaxID=1183424 RepID=A0A1S7SAV0_AGRTU|nr:hypothetical protein AGR4C_pa50033 [Agrobacterium tumefaciens str. Kerr 14]
MTAAGGIGRRRASIAGAIERRYEGTVLLSYSLS